MTRPTCAAASCHGNGRVGTTGGEHSTWAAEVFPQGAHDPHSRAYRVLFNAESQRMAAELKIPAAHESSLCLKCHAVDGVQPAGVAPQHRRDIMVDQTSELQPLAFSPFGQQDSHLFDDGAQIEFEGLKV